jgi:SAM-dependent methyltransferase
MDLTAITGFDDHTFDLIFCSNALEHVSDVPAFLSHACRLLTPEGTLIVAVPPITTPYLRAANVVNPHHVNIWSPQQWNTLLGSYFARTTYYLHCLGQRGQIVDFQAPTSTVIPHTAWIFEPVSFDTFVTIPTLTAIFVLQQPQTPLPQTHSLVQMRDDSYTLHTREPLLMELASTVVQQEQQLHHAGRMISQLHTDLADRDQRIAEKNAHIRHCEDVIRRLEQGRLMRLLRWLHR